MVRQCIVYTRHRYVMRLVVLLNTMIYFSSTKESDPSRLDNSVVGIPVILCEHDRIRVQLETTRPFAGKIFVKGEYANRECVRSYVDGNPLSPKEVKDPQLQNSTQTQNNNEETTSSGKSSSADNTESGPDPASAPELTFPPTDGSGPVEENPLSIVNHDHKDSSLRTSEENKLRTTSKKSISHDIKPITVDEHFSINPVQSRNKLYDKINLEYENHKGEGDINWDIRDAEKSKWLGYGGVSPKSRNANEFIGVFGGSHNEEWRPQLKIYQKSKSNEANKFPILHYPEPQQISSSNCEQKCAPCICSGEDRPQERKRRENKNHVELTVPLGTCNTKRDRKLSPPTLSISFVAVISFHESFITKLDKAYHIQCVYMEINKTMNTQLDVGTAEASEVTGTATAPVCSYHIFDSDGRSIQNIHVGEQVKHVWNCTTTAPGLHSILVHSCFIEDGAGQRYEVINEHGCSMDPYILKTPKYESNKPMASVDAFMMKFPDRSSVDFQCSIKVCSKIDQQCSTITPPDCSSSRTSPRRRREASAEVDSITIHSNTLMVFDVDAAEGVPQPLAHSEKLRIPTELCLSIAGFGILVSASTFLTTVTFAVAFANIYMKARNKW